MAHDGPQRGEVGETLTFRRRRETDHRRWSGEWSASYYSMPAKILPLASALRDRTNELSRAIARR